MRRFLLLCFGIFSLGKALFAQELPPNFPPLEIYGTDQAAEGILYLGNFPREGIVTPEVGNFAIGISNRGEVVFFQEFSPPTRAFNVQGHPDGTVTYYLPRAPGIGGRGGVGMQGAYYRVNAAGQTLASYEVVPPLSNTTLHDILFLENGNHLLISHDRREMDLSPFGGNIQAIVVTGSVQEIRPDGQLAWQWNGWDHLALEGVADMRILQANPPNPADYVHMNSLALDADGDLIVSLRNQDAILKISRSTGEILWRLGGVQSDFHFVNDAGFSRQHQPSVLENGNLLLFDNGNRNQLSRAVEYALDFENMSATLVWEYANGQFGPSLGSVQRLSNGNTLISWGSSQQPMITEVTAEGEVALSVRLPADHVTYRAYKLE